jgi:hypothetical protein
MVNCEVVFSELMQAIGRTPASLNTDLEILAKYHLVRIFREPNPGHGVRKTVESTFADECIQVIAEF